MTTHHSSSLGAATPAGPLSILAGIALLINGVGLFAFTGLAVAIFGYIAVTVGLLVAAGLHEPKTRAGEAAITVFVLSWMAALATGVCVGAFHWVRFPYAAYVTLGLYGLAVAIWLCGRLLRFLVACWFGSLGAALWAAVILLPAPPGSEDPDDRTNRTGVVAQFVDEAGRGVEDVEVWFDLKWFWQDDPKLREKPDAHSLRIDNSYGLPQGSAAGGAADDPRYKVLVIRSRRGPHYTGQDAGYEDLRYEMPLPRRGKEYHVRLALTERPHPDVAFLDVTAEPGGEKPIVTLRLGREAKLPRPGDRQGDSSRDDAERWPLANVSHLSGYRGVLRVGGELANHPLFLHAHSIVGKWETVHPVEPLRLGERRRMTLRVQ